MKRMAYHPDSNMGLYLKGKLQSKTTNQLLADLRDNIKNKKFSDNKDMMLRLRVCAAIVMARKIHGQKI